MSRLKVVSGLVAMGLFIAGVLVFLTYPVSSKDQSKKNPNDPGSGITSLQIGL